MDYEFAMWVHSRLETVLGVVRNFTLSAGGEYPERFTSCLSKFRTKVFISDLVEEQESIFITFEVKLCRNKLGVAVSILWQVNCHMIQLGDQLGSSHAYF